MKEVGEKVQEKARAAAESPALNQKENPGQKEFPERVIAGSSSEQEKALPVAASYPTRSGGEVRHDSPEEAARAERGMKTPGVLAEQAQGQQPALEERVEAAREQRDVARLWAGPQVEVRRAAAERAEAALKAGLSPTGTSEAALHRVAIAARDRFTERLGEVYRDPVAAREAFNEAVRTRGFAEALETLHSQPEKLGRLKGAAVLGYETGQRQHARSEAEALHTYAANAVAHEAASYRLRVAQLLQANRAAQVERLGRANGGRLEQLGRVYRDPEAALAAFDRAAGRALPGTGRMPNADFAAAMKVLAERPEAYGELRGGYAGWAEVEDLDRVAARKVAASSGRPGSDLEKALREGQTARAYVALATAPGVEADRVMERYRAEYEGVRARLEALPKKEHAQDLLQGALATSGPEARRRAGAEAERLGQAVQDVGAGEERLAAARQEGRARSARVDEAFGRLHANPVQAREAYEKAAGLDPKAERYERASAHLQVEPQAYGTLKDGLQSQAKEQSREATDMHKAYAEKVKESGQALGSLKEARAAFQKAAGVITDGGKLGRELDEKGLRQTVVNYNMEKGEQAVQTAATLRGGPLGRVASNLARRATQEMRQAAGVDRDI